MKAYLYAVCTEGAGWRAGLTIARLLDERFWMDPAFRRGAEAGWGRRRESVAPGGLPRELVWVDMPMPLGLAVTAWERMKAKFSRGEASDGCEATRSAVRWAWSRAGEPSGSVADQIVRIGIGERGGKPGDGAYECGCKLGQQAREMADKLRGRQLLLAEVAAAFPEIGGGELRALLQLAFIFGGVELVSGVKFIDAGAGRLRRRRPADLQCRRCGSREARRDADDSRPGLRQTPCASCGRQRCAYCEACLTMGRSRECGLLVIGAPSPSVQASAPQTSAAGSLSRWNLSPAQHEAAGAALAFVQRRLNHEGKPRGLRSLFPRRTGETDGTFLLWAVTGAGKTEMMFPLLESVLSAGGRCAIAAPRRDVVLELAPRLKKAFPHVRHAVLYGGSPERFETGDITLATTHQLIRFREAFDLVVIDEVDAFPYHNDRTLHYAASQARTSGGASVLLSATPPAAMQRSARSGRLPHARVSVRFHRRPLPVPRRLVVPPIARWAGERQIPAKLRAAIEESLHRGAQVFLFVPYIRQVEPLVRCLREYAPAWRIDGGAIEGTSSPDPHRDRKVSAFRARDIRLLVTTTILERGVTIPKSDVIVLDADKPLFDAASLVQMAGRAGRAADDPDGRVYFAAPDWTIPQRDACRQIREMNAYAKRKGYLLPDGAIRRTSREV